MKHAEFYSKNKFEELVHIVGFIIRIYHDAWSSECKIPLVSLKRELCFPRKAGCCCTIS